MEKIWGQKSHDSVPGTCLLSGAQKFFFIYQKLKHDSLLTNKAYINVFQKIQILWELPGVGFRTDLQNLC